MVPIRYVIAYDLDDDRRREKVAELLKSYGRRVEKSVFECEVTRAEIAQIRARLGELLVSTGDRCHIYRLCAECAGQRIVFGTDLEQEWAQVVIV